MIIKVILILAFVVSGVADEDAPVQSHENRVLIIGFSRDVFADVHIPDALAAMKVWASELTRNRGVAGSVETKVFENLVQASDAIMNHAVDLIILTTSEYLKIPARSEIEPYFVHTRNGKILEESLILVHSQSGINNLSDLKGKQIILMNHARTSAGKIWLESLILEDGYKNLEDFFANVQVVDKSSKTVLPVYFKQKDACLIHRGGFDMISELNPQLRRELKILVVSPATTPSVTCIRSDFDPELKNILIDALGNLHNEPRGQQILLLFKVDALESFKASFLDGTRQLIEKHYLLLQGTDRVNFFKESGKTAGR